MSTILYARALKYNNLINHEHTTSNTDLAGRWLDNLYLDLNQATELADKHVIGCKNISGDTTLLHSRKLNDQPEKAYHWLRQFTQRNNLALKPRQTNVHVPSELRKRRQTDSPIGLGVNLLMQKSAQHIGMRLPALGNSARNSFRATHPRIDATSAVAISHQVRNNGQPFNIAANHFLTGAQEAMLYACVLSRGGAKKTFAYFEADGLHALGYQAGNDYIFDFIIAGGFGESAALHKRGAKLDNERLNLTLFRTHSGHSYFGVLRACYSIAIDDNAIRNADSNDDSSETPISDLPRQNQPRQPA